MPDSYPNPADAPRRMRTGLQQRTRAVRRYFKPIRTLNQVGFAMPIQVLGGDLLCVLSRALQEKLLLTSPAPNDMAERAPSHPLPSAFSFAPKPDRFTGLPFLSTEAERGASDGQALAWDPMTEGGEELQWVQEGTRTALPSSLFEILHARRDVSGLPTSAPPQSVGRSFEQAGANRLLAALREYWRIRQEARPGGSLPDSTIEPARLLPGVPANSVPVPAHVETSQFSLSDWMRREASQGIRGALGMGRTRGGPAQTTLPSASPSRGSAIGMQPFEIHNTFHLALSAPLASSEAGDELAERVADILREQALRHGIDLA